MCAKARFNVTFKKIETFEENIIENNWNYMKSAEDFVEITFTNPTNKFQV